ncbi:MAG: RNA methyltransferase, partial [Acidobacteriota bacterium]
RPQADALRFSARSVIVYADGLQDPGNLGALARSAEAAGAAALCLSPSSVHPNHPRALRASAGSLLRLPIAVDCPVEQLEAQLADHRPRWLGLTQRGGQSLYEANFDGCLVLALGAEASGLSVNVQDHLTQAITIPTQPPVESLNATVAASIVLFEIARRQSEGQRVTQPTREAQA